LYTGSLTPAGYHPLTTRLSGHSLARNLHATPTVRIDELALLSDCRTAALTDRSGTVVWFSPRRFDRPSVFGALLDADAGHWSIRPRGAADVERRYLDDGPILETTFRTDAGEVVLTDALSMRPGASGHEIGGDAVTHLVRRAQCRRGQVDLEVELVARPEYGLVRPYPVPRDDGWDLVGGPVPLQLAASHPPRVEGDDLRGSVTLAAGDSAEWVLSAGPSDGRSAEVALMETGEAWRSWAALHPQPAGAHGGAMRRSAMVLQALTYAPSGVVVAAPTTSLPERVGGKWNWDYRFAWLRDLSFVTRALWVASCPDEPSRYLEWIARALGRLDGGHVQIMFGLDGERDLSEHTLEHLSGFRDSRPVRIGNDAWSQRQLDVSGEVLDSAYLLRDYLGEEVTRPVRELLVGLAAHAASHWREPDFGMWESRGEPRHYVSSKVMCWVALDRAIRLAPRLGAGNEVRAWSAERDRIRSAVLEDAWNADMRAFTGALGSDRLDASVLLMPLVGMIDGADERMRSTVERLEQELATDHGVQRWADEGSGFLLCGFWLAECLALGGQTDRAEERFAATAAAANDLGLMAEEAAIDSGEPLGNFPQALSHVGLINAAWRLHELQEGRDSS
jgi:GH15 family glucan-1,4-alpha-glucosidase